MKLNKKYSMLSILTLISSPTYAQLYLCKACNPGTYATAGATSCTSCSAGTYQNLSGQSSCKTCGAGTYSNTAGATDCTSCSAGTYSSAGASSCSACTGNTYSNAGASSCTACASGYIVNSSHTGCDEAKSCNYSFKAYCDGNYINSCSGGIGGCYSAGSFYEKGIREKVENLTIDTKQKDSSGAYSAFITSKNGIVYKANYVEMCRESHGVASGGATSISFDINIAHGDSVNGKTCDNGVLK